MLVHVHAINVHHPCHDGKDSANPSVPQELVSFGTAAEDARPRALKCASSHISSVLNCLCVDESTKCDLFCVRSLQLASMEMPR